MTAILIWVGGDSTLTTLGIVFKCRDDGIALAELGKMGAWVGTRVYAPALFAAFAFGVALIQKGSLGWRDAAVAVPATRTADERARAIGPRELMATASAAPTATPPLPGPASVSVT